MRGPPVEAAALGKRHLCLQCCRCTNISLPALKAFRSAFWGLWSSRTATGVGHSFQLPKISFEALGVQKIQTDGSRCSRAAAAPVATAGDGVPASVADAAEQRQKRSSGTRCLPLPLGYRLSLPEKLPNAVPLRRQGSASVFQGYRRQHLLGTGTYAEVWCVQQEGTGLLYAAKLLQPNKFSVDTAPRVCQMFEKEIVNLALCQCPGVVTLFEVVEGAEGWLLVLELVNGGTVWAEDVCSNESEAFCLFMQLLQAILHIQACKVIHRDLKPTNMLLTKSKRVLIADFGWSEAEEACNTHSLEWPGTLEINPPEVLTFQGPWTVKIDNYALTAAAPSAAGQCTSEAAAVLATASASVPASEATPLELKQPEAEAGAPRNAATAVPVAPPPTVMVAQTTGQPTGAPQKANLGAPHILRRGLSEVSDCSTAESVGFNALMLLGQRQQQQQQRQQQQQPLTDADASTGPPQSSRGSLHATEHLLEKQQGQKYLVTRQTAQQLPCRVSSPRDVRLHSQDCSTILELQQARQQQPRVPWLVLGKGDDSSSVEQKPKQDNTSPKRIAKTESFDKASMAAEEATALGTKPRDARDTTAVTGAPEHSSVAACARWIRSGLGAVAALATPRLVQRLPESQPRQQYNHRQHQEDKAHQPQHCVVESRGYWRESDSTRTLEATWQRAINVAAALLMSLNNQGKRMASHAPRSLGDGSNTTAMGLGRTWGRRCVRVGLRPSAAHTKAPLTGGEVTASGPKGLVVGGRPQVARSISSIESPGDLRALERLAPQKCEALITMPTGKDGCPDAPRNSSPNSSTKKSNCEKSASASSPNRSSSYNSEETSTSDCNTPRTDHLASPACQGGNEKQLKNVQQHHQPLKLSPTVPLLPLGDLPLCSYTSTGSVTDRGRTGVGAICMERHEDGIQTTFQRSSRTESHVEAPCAQNIRGHISSTPPPAQIVSNCSANGSCCVTNSMQLSLQNKVQGEEVFCTPRVPKWDYARGTHSAARSIPGLPGGVDGQATAAEAPWQQLSNGFLSEALLIAQQQQLERQQRELLQQHRELQLQQLEIECKRREREKQQKELQALQAQLYQKRAMRLVQQQQQQQVEHPPCHIQRSLSVKQADEFEKLPDFMDPVSGRSIPLRPLNTSEAQESIEGTLHPAVEANSLVEAKSNGSSTVSNTEASRVPQKQGISVPRLRIAHAVAPNLLAGIVPAIARQDTGRCRSFQTVHPTGFAAAAPADPVSSSGCNVTSSAAEMTGAVMGSPRDTQSSFSGDEPMRQHTDPSVPAAATAAVSFLQNLVTNPLQRLQQLQHQTDRQTHQKSAAVAAAAKIANCLISEQPLTKSHTQQRSGENLQQQKS
ncbi:serine/threonine-protein kinase par-1 [Cyclospora cayetanensis]|uniref:Serine/threonine-protein kinase par-1 n=1 Tax=Cyclospora cayetanensis TaxID=88456 RepID=A0A6P6RZP6_9EIME|nr:serine/threonine-protein kinase par-1 [Cyclospora cayetanensis]